MSLQSTDPVADMLTHIRNAALVGKRQVSLPTSKLKVTVAKELQKAGYIVNVVTEKASPRDRLIITINDPGNNPKITEIAKVSRPGRRVYAGVSEIPKVKSGRGIVLVSTSRGIMTGQEAVKQRLGGELLCKVY